MGSHKHKKKYESESSSSDSDASSSSTESTNRKKKHLKQSKHSSSESEEEMQSKSKRRRSSDDSDTDVLKKRKSRKQEGDERNFDRKYKEKDRYEGVKDEEKRREKNRQKSPDRDESRDGKSGGKSKDRENEELCRKNYNKDRYENRDRNRKDYNSKERLDDKYRNKRDDHRREDRRSYKDEGNVRGAKQYRDDNNDYRYRGRDKRNNNRYGNRRRSNSFDHTNAKWGKQESTKSEKNESQQKEKPNFSLSGKLTEETNTYKGVVIKYSEPPEARKARRRWRLYPFKGEKALQTLYIHRESAYLIGRERKVVDLPVDHPSCSKQHAAIQYRLVPFTRDDGSSGKRVRPYLIDLESANGTFINNKKIDSKKYVELFEKDVIKFGFSSREYVLLHENSKDEGMDDDVKQEEEELPIKTEPQ